MEDSDIEIGYVYCCSTYRATNESAITVEQGDGLILLDDCAFYWWFVKAMRDGSLGYLPAENIESQYIRGRRKLKNLALFLYKTPLFRRGEREGMKIGLLDTTKETSGIDCLEFLR
jgi:hypothetical protein